METKSKNKYPQLVEIGRSFYDTFSSLGKGEKARLRRSENPLTEAAGVFYHCSNQATRDFAPLSQYQLKLFSRLLRVFEVIQEPVKDSSVGHLLKANRGSISQVRAEALFHPLDMDELVDSLGAILSQLDPERRRLDPGTLFADLWELNYLLWVGQAESSRVLERWARDYYHDTRKKEE